MENALLVAILVSAAGVAFGIGLVAYFGREIISEKVDTDGYLCYKHGMLGRWRRSSLRLREPDELYKK